jgi:hypothetical protein
MFRVALANHHMVLAHISGKSAGASSGLQSVIVDNTKFTSAQCTSVHTWKKEDRYSQWPTSSSD